MLQEEVMKSLIDEKILYYEKLQNLVCFTKPFYFVFSKEWIKQTKKKMSPTERIQYYYWKKTKSHKFETLYKSFINSNEAKFEIPYEFFPKKNQTNSIWIAYRSLISKIFNRTN